MMLQTVFNSSQLIRFIHFQNLKKAISIIILLITIIVISQEIFTYYILFILIFTQLISEKVKTNSEYIKEFN